MDMACKEVTGLLQDYLAEYKRFDPHMPIDTVHLGRSLALEIGKTAAKNQLYVGKYWINECIIFMLLIQLR